MSRAQPGGIAALFRDYRHFVGKRLWLALALMILGALAEGFGLLMIVPLASIAIGGDSTFFRFAPWAAAWSPDQRFLIALGAFVGAMAARSLLLFARDQLIAWLAAEYEASLRLRAATTLAGRGWPFASRIGQGGMQSLLLNEVPRSGEAAGYIQQMAVALTMLAVQVTLTFILSPVLTLVALGFLALGSLATLRSRRRGVRSGLDIIEAMEESAGAGFRLHAGLKAALAQGTLPAFAGQYRASLAVAARQFTRFARHYSFMQQAAALAAAAVAAVLLLIGVRVLALPFPVLVTSLVLFARMSGPAQLLQNSVVSTAAYAPAFAAIERRLGPLEWTAPVDVKHEPLAWDVLRLEHVSFIHPSGHGLRDASLQLAAGEWLGLAGASGAGKTTLVDLVAGLIAPQHGSIRVDGRALSDNVLERWRAGLVYVGQEASVFDNRVRANLLAEGAEASDDLLWQALAIVGLAERVRTMPAGLDEQVGDRGSQLSGGERQRLVLARALLRRPSLLILDEATAALDADSEATLIDRLKAQVPRAAAIVVAHRESTLRHCDSVITIQHGAVTRAS